MNYRCPHCHQSVIGATPTDGKVTCPHCGKHSRVRATVAAAPPSPPPPPPSPNISSTAASAPSDGQPTDPPQACPLPAAVLEIGRSVNRAELLEDDGCRVRLEFAAQDRESLRRFKETIQPHMERVERNWSIVLALTIAHLVLSLVVGMIVVMFSEMTFTFALGRWILGLAIAGAGWWYMLRLHDGNWNRVPEPPSSAPLPARPHLMGRIAMVTTVCAVFALTTAIWMMTWVTWLPGLVQDLIWLGGIAWVGMEIWRGTDMPYPAMKFVQGYQYARNMTAYCEKPLDLATIAGSLNPWTGEPFVDTPLFWRVGVYGNKLPDQIDLHRFAACCAVLADQRRPYLAWWRERAFELRTKAESRRGERRLCTLCEGKGKIHSGECPTCKGRGKVEVAIAQHVAGYRDAMLPDGRLISAPIWEATYETQTCAECNGTGQKHRTCPSCHGTGSFERTIDEIYRTEYHPMIEKEFRHRFPGASPIEAPAPAAKEPVASVS